MKKGYCIVSGGVQPKLASDVAKALGAEIIATELKTFANGERYARLEDTVRNKDLFIFQSCGNSKEYTINDALMETLIIVDAARRASAKEISVVLPFMPYSRQDRKARTREPITAALVLNMLKQAGVHRIITLDLHSTQIQSAFPGPFENLSARSLLLKEVSKIVKEKEGEDFIVVAPDAGSVKNSSKFATELNLPLVFMPKSRDEKDPTKITRTKIAEDLNKKNCLIFDDMIDTGGTIISAAEGLKNAGAKKIIVCATHGLLSLNAAERLKNSDVDLVIATNSLPQQYNEEILGKKMKTISIAPLLTNTIKSVDSGDNIVDID